MPTRRRRLPLQRSGIPGRDLRRHQAVMRFIGICASIGFLEQRRVGAPLHVHRIAHHEYVLGHYLQPASASLRRRLHHLHEHRPERCLATHHLPIRTEKLYIFWKLRHQPRPIATGKSSHMLFHHLRWRRLALERRHRLSNQWGTQKTKRRKPANEPGRTRHTNNFHKNHDSALAAASPNEV